MAEAAKKLVTHDLHSELIPLWTGLGAGVVVVIGAVTASDVLDGTTGRLPLFSSTLCCTPCTNRRSGKIGCERRIIREKRLQIESPVARDGTTYVSGLSVVEKGIVWDRIRWNEAILAPELLIFRRVAGTDQIGSSKSQPCVR